MSDVEVLVAFLIKAAPLYILYPLKPLPPVSVDTLHERSIWLELAAFAVSPVGTLGGVVSAWVVVHDWPLWADSLPASSTAETV